MGNELYHYGVKGMKWGVRKDPSKAYAKSSKTAESLKKKAASLEKKSEKYHAKTVKRMARPSFTDFGVAKERRMSKRDAKYQVQAKRARVKADKFEGEMRSAFKDVSIKDISKEDLDVGRDYVDMLLKR